MSTGDGLSHAPNTIVVEAGAQVEDVQSGSKLDVQSGANQTVEGTETIESGGVLNVASGGALEIAGTNVTSEVANLVVPVSDNQHFIGLENILHESAGTWTMTRIAAGDYALELTAAAETAIVGIDITDAIRTSASKGFELTSIDVVHSIATANLTSNTLTLSLVNYAASSAETVTNVPLAGSGACSTTAGSPDYYVDNIAVSTPAYNNTPCSKYVAELTVVNPGTSVFHFFGLNLHFTKSTQ